MKKPRALFASEDKDIILFCLKFSMIPHLKEKIHSDVCTYIPSARKLQEKKSKKIIQKVPFPAADI